MNSRAALVTAISIFVTPFVVVQRAGGQRPENTDLARRPASAASSFVANQLADTPSVSTSRSVILVPNDDTIAPLGRQINLVGKTIDLVRTGAGSFRSTTGPLQLDSDRGTKITLDPKTLLGTYTIEGFEFPFFSTSRRTLHVSRLLAIYFEPPPPSPNIRQFNDAELLLQTTPVIAPLLTTLLSQTSFLPPAVFVQEHADRVVLTWFEATRPLEVQVVLFRSGDVRFSYGSVGNLRSGALYITSGSEPWRAPTPIASVTDGIADFATSNPPEIAAMLDIENASVQRIGNTNLVQFVIDVRSDIDREALGPHGTIGVNVNLSTESFLSATISGAGVAKDAFSSKHFAVTGSTLMMRVEGDTITLTFPQEHALGDGESSFELTVSVANQFGGDSATIAGTIGPPPQPSRTDFATATSVASFTGPISDAFLVPSTNVFAVWQRAQERYDLDPETIDGFVVYETFPTLGVPVASVGNAGVDHIATGDAISSTKPREPNLIEMHQLRYLWNNSDDNAMQVLLHEWGHRWMFFIEHDEDGVPTNVLNDGGHPAIYVDTRAAFTVNNPYDCSVMGGATFTDHGNGTFTGPPDTCGAGYSWLDLYLMGLASPGEVPDFFYLTNLDPPIEEVGYVEAQTFHGTRRNVSIGDVTSRMGQRSPAFPDTQRTFKVLFALVYDPAEPIAAEDVDLVAHYAALFRARFAAATGHRASVDTSFGESRRARPVRR